MVADEKDWAGESTSPLIDEGLLAGLALLWRAYIRAHATGANVWDFDLRTGRLYLVGMTGSDLRWMVAEGFAEHGREPPGYGDTAARSLRRGNEYSFDEHTSLILTPRGAALSEHVLFKTARWPQATLPTLAAVAAEIPALATERHTAYETNRPARSASPHWNAARRELFWGDRIVKRFRVPARNQERILSVFEEEGWAEHIHDPLPVTDDIDAPTRLHDAINRLNKCQINPLLRFRGDGRGTGVLWELSQPNLSA